MIRWLVRLLLRLLALLLALVLAAAIAVAVLWPLTPGVGDLGERIDARLSAHGASDLAQLPTPDRVGMAIIATEDSRFYSHHGLDVGGILRKALTPILGDAGAATLDQQLAKVIYSPGQHGVWATIEQAELALKLDARYSKDEILNAYLSSVYFGNGYYGLPQATRGYFGLDPGELDWAQASLLAGLVQAPSAYNPLEHLDRARARQEHVLDRLVETGVLSQAEADQAYAEPLHLQ